MDDLVERLARAVLERASWNGWTGVEANKRKDIADAAVELAEEELRTELTRLRERETAQAVPAPVVAWRWRWADRDEWRISDDDPTTAMEKIAPIVVEPLYALTTPSPPSPDILIDPIIQWMIRQGWLDAGNEYTATDLVTALEDNASPLAEPSPEDDLRAARDQINYLAITHRGYDAWAAKPHNRKWVKRIEGTPIPSDLIVCIGVAFAEAIRSRAPVAVKAGEP